MESDEKFYEAVVRELETQGPRKGLWAKAYAEAGGGEAAARAIYIRLRAAQLMEEQQLDAAEIQRARKGAERVRREHERKRQKEAPEYAARDPGFLDPDSLSPMSKRFVVAFALVFLVAVAGLVIYFASSVK